MKSYFIMLFLSAIAWGQSAPERAEIRSVKIQGSGCEESTASASFSPDLKDLSVLFDNYSVEIGKGSPNPNAMTQQKNCFVDIHVFVPAGWQYAFKSIDYRGFVTLPASAWGFHRFSSMSANSIVPSLKEVTHKGPLNNDYTFHVETRPERRVWSPCISGAHQIRLLSQLGVSFYPKSSDRSFSSLNLDSQDLSLRQSLGVEWRRCSQAGTPPEAPRRPRF